MEFRLRRKGGPPVLGGMPTRNREDLALCTLRKAPIRMVRKHPGIGAKLPTVDDAEQRAYGGLVAGDQTRQREHPLATYSTSIIRSLVIRRLRT